MRGIIAAGAYVPHHRLDRSAVSTVFGKGGGRGTRSVSSFDEDTTSMAVEASRRVVRGLGDVSIDQLWYSTAKPAYLEKTNATAIHAALRLAPTIPAIDMGGATRSGIGALAAALNGTGTTLVVSSDERSGFPTSEEESAGGDAAAAVMVGDDGSAPLVAEVLGSVSRSEEFLDRWRVPGGARSRAWEPRFAEGIYGELFSSAWADALEAASISADAVDRVAATGLHTRAVGRAIKGLKLAEGVQLDDLSGTVGQTGTAHPSLMVASLLDTAEPGQIVVLASLVDGVDIIVLRATEAVAKHRPVPSVTDQIESGAEITYGQFLSWTGMVTVEPPNRPSPNRVSASASHRSDQWKFGFVGSRDRSSGMVHMPPARVSQRGGNVDDMEGIAMSDSVGTVVSFTIDKLVYSPSPPVIFAVVDFDGGGRVPLELADVRADDVAEGLRVTPTFRRLYTADEIHNYFWKVRPVQQGEAL